MNITKALEYESNLNCKTDQLLISFFLWINTTNLAIQVPCLIMQEFRHAYTQRHTILHGENIYALICMEMTKHVGPKDVISNLSY